MISYLKSGVAITALLMLVTPCFSANEENVVSGYEEAFDQLRETHNPNYHGSTVEDAIKALFEGGEEDRGTYPPSDFWNRDGDLRRSKPPQLRYRGEIFFKYSNDDVSEVEKFEKEFSINLRYEDWAGYFRFSDANVFSYENDPMRWEKASIRWKKGDTKVTVGTFGVLFGRGLAVNLYEDRILEFDNELEGIKIEQEAGDADITALWGTRKDIKEDRNSSMTASRLELPVFDSLDIGVHAASITFPDVEYSADMPIEYDYNILGGDFSYREGNFRLYGEMVKVGRDENPDSPTEWDFLGEDGRGYYVNAGYSGTGYALNLEYKDYRAIGHPFSVLPPLRRFKEQATADPGDDKGYSAELTWNPFGDGSHFVFNYAQGNIHEKGMPYREVGAAYNSPATSDTTWVIELWDVDIHGEKQSIQGLTVNQQIDEDWTASTYLEHERRRAPFYETHTDYIAEGELAFRSNWNIIYIYEVTGEETDDRDTWRLWEIRYKPDEDQEFNLVYGARREGYVCSGGICRLEPAFEGVRLDYLRRF